MGAGGAILPVLSAPLNGLEVVERFGAGGGSCSIHGLLPGPQIAPSPGLKSFSSPSLSVVGLDIQGAPDPINSSEGALRGGRIIEEVDDEARD